MPVATPLITATDLRTALGPQLYIAVFDDDNIGEASIIDASPQVAQVLRRVHARTVSWLSTIYQKVADGTDAQIPDLLYDAELLYAQAMSIERHPEYAKQYGESGRLKLWQTQADAIMKDIVQSIRRITDAPPEPVPRNVGGIVYNTGARVMVDGSDGTSNSGDF